MDKLILVVAQKDYLQRETGVLRIWSSGKHPRALIGLKVRHNSEEEKGRCGALSSANCFLKGAVPTERVAVLICRKRRCAASYFIKVTNVDRGATFYHGHNTD